MATEKVWAGSVCVDALYVRGSSPWQREEGGTTELWVLPLESVCEGLGLRPSEVRGLAQAGDLAEELGFGGCRYSNGPGRAFSHGAYARVAHNRVVVSIRHDLDI